MRLIISAHYCISGFTQHCGLNHGLVTLSERLLIEGFGCGPQSRVYLHPWRLDAESVAEHAWILQRLHAAELAIGIYAYSWGAGYGAIKLCNSLADRGLDVDALVLCDPVPRPSLLFRWQALLPARWSHRAIIVPANVRRCWSLFQRRNVPQGHPVVARDPALTEIVPGEQLDFDHHYMDDAPRFHQLALKAAATVGRSSIR